MSLRKNSQFEQNLPPVKVKIPPQGKRTKPIVIEGEFLSEESEALVLEQNKVIAKHLLYFGLKLD